MIDHNAALLTLGDAVERILAEVAPVSDAREVELADALGRVLAARVDARVDVPPADNSAMDGYAVRVGDVGPQGARLRVSQRIFAGASGDRVDAGTAARIFTGAPVPAGADAVVAQEVCEAQGEHVLVPGPLSVGQNVRRAGEGARRGDVVLEAGARIGPQELAIAASVGHGRLLVRGRPRVATFSTGDELCDPGQSLGPGQIYDSNRAMLRGLIDGLGCEVVDLGRIPDAYDRTLEVLRDAAESADAIVTSGGVSVGEADHVHRAASELGRLDFWRVAIKPGKPVAFGRIGKAGFFGLPGNPVSAFVTFCLFARPFLVRLAGRSDVLPARRMIAAGFEREVSATRREFLRARAELDLEGGESLRLFGHQGSHVLSSLAWATGLAELPPGAHVRPGDPVAFLPFAELLR